MPHFLLRLLVVIHSVLTINTKFTVASFLVADGWAAARVLGNGKMAYSGSIPGRSEAKIQDLCKAI
jgi:hypothetical protein